MSTFDPKSKLAKVREAMANEDWELAIRLAAKFPSLGEHEAAIHRAKDAASNAHLYAQLGYDLAAIRQQGIEALKERFSRSWDAVERGREQEP